MPAYLIIKVFKVLKVDATTKYNLDGGLNVSITADNPLQINWAVISAANKWEADGKAKENLELWLAANKEQFDKDRAEANHVTENVFTWEIDPAQAELIANIMVNALKETISLK